MTNDVATGSSGVAAAKDEKSFKLKSGLAQMLKGGVIMDVTDAKQVVRRFHSIP